MKQIKYSKDLLFLKPFVDAASRLVPLKNVKSIRSYKVKRGLKERSYGSIIIDKNQCSINILAYKWQKDENKYIADTLAILLDTLAHELAHTIHNEHSYKHFRLQSLILYKFSIILKKLGITDTSNRFNNLR